VTPDREQFLYLTTRGRTSGEPREIEIWFTERASLFYIIAEYPTAHWVQNIRAHSDVSVRVRDSAFAASARVLDPQADAALILEVQVLSREKYRWGEGLIVELTPSN